MAALAELLRSYESTALAARGRLLSVLPNWLGRLAPSFLKNPGSDISTCAHDDSIGYAKISYTTPLPPPPCNRTMAVYSSKSPLPDTPYRLSFGDEFLTSNLPRPILSTVRGWGYVGTSSSMGGSLMRYSLPVMKHFRHLHVTTSSSPTTAAAADNTFCDGSDGTFKPNPFNRRFALSKKPFFPIEPRNLRSPGNRKRKKTRGRGDKSSARGIRKKHDSGSSPHGRTWEGGKTPLYRRLPKWPEAWLGRQRKGLEPLNLSKLRYFIEKGRLDARFPITQRHLNDSGCCKVKGGIRLFNVNDYPFPYKIDLDVAGADQSSINAINRIGGSVTITYRNRVNLRAHVKPFKYEVLPRTGRPNLEMVHYLEKMRARGCNVRYIKPQWLIDEERRLRMELHEFEAESAIAEGRSVIAEGGLSSAAVEEHGVKLLLQFRTGNRPTQQSR